MPRTITLKSPRSKRETTITLNTATEEKRLKVLQDRHWAIVEESNSPDDSPPSSDVTTGDKPLDLMNKADLQELCDNQGIDYTEEDTKAILIEKIRAVGE